MVSDLKPGPVDRPELTTVTIDHQGMVIQLLQDWKRRDASKDRELEELRGELASMHKRYDEAVHGKQVIDQAARRINQVLSATDERCTRNEAWFEKLTKQSQEVQTERDVAEAKAQALNEELDQTRQQLREYQTGEFRTKSDLLFQSLGPIAGSKYGNDGDLDTLVAQVMQEHDKALEDRHHSQGEENRWREKYETLCQRQETVKLHYEAELQRQMVSVTTQLARVLQRFQDCQGNLMRVTNQYQEKLMCFHQTLCRLESRYRRTYDKVRRRGERLLDAHRNAGVRYHDLQQKIWFVVQACDLAGVSPVACPTEMRMSTLADHSYEHLNGLLAIYQQLKARNLVLEQQLQTAVTR
ncbi:hypothetical protein IWQ60_006662 [Tieghemiomyces parasiticus]|uniref:Uncharacterized protein n=1 Tax=Tieghemiomyces parasiticus TaxID=78921 RepID=A0A9W8DT51_9FUNG|nr:hypothetical protein IWQ60_006662 [Tieghemiomyces parasiticus]